MVPCRLLALVLLVFLGIGHALAETTMIGANIPACTISAAENLNSAVLDDASKRSFEFPVHQQERFALAAAQTLHALGLVIRQHNLKDGIWRVVGQRTSVAVHSLEIADRSSQSSNRGETLEIKFILSTSNNSAATLFVEAKYGYTRLTDPCLYGQVLAELRKQYSILGL